MSSEFIIRAIILGYILMGYYSVLKVSTTPLHDRPIYMMKPNILKKVFWAISWPVHAFIEIYYLHMPHKAHAITYAAVSVPILWLGFTVFGGIILYPLVTIDNGVLAFFAAMACLILGSFILMPIITLICTFLTMILAKPILVFFPKKN